VPARSTSICWSALLTRTSILDTIQSAQQECFKHVESFFGAQCSGHSLSVKHPQSALPTSTFPGSRFGGWVFWSKRKQHQAAVARRKMHGPAPGIRSAGISRGAVRKHLVCSPFPSSMEIVLQASGSARKRVAAVVVIDQKHPR
jgi:hypothetical protein